MRLALKLHPDSISAAANCVDVEVAHQNGVLALSYVVIGKISSLRIPPLATFARADALWRHTCFEAFLSVPSATGYYEFNFSPSTQWAIYRFNGYRSGMQVASEIDAPRIETAASSDSYTLRADLDLANLRQGARCRLGLSAVIEEAGGSKSYWALAHAPGKPDFHRSDCFTHEFS
jgi:hypothetical protein